MLLCWRTFEPIPILAFPLKGKEQSSRSSPFKRGAGWGMGRSEHSNRTHTHPSLSLEGEGTRSIKVALLKLKLDPLNRGIADISKNVSCCRLPPFKLPKRNGIRVRFGAID